MTVNTQERHYCNHCEQSLRPGREVWLELNCRTGEWALPGSQEWSDGEDSQGCFPFGPDCADAILKGRLTDSQKSTPA